MVGSDGLTSFGFPPAGRPLSLLHNKLCRLRLDSVYCTSPFWCFARGDVLTDDSFAFQGQVEPPPSIFLTESACQALQSSLFAQSITSKASISFLATLSSNSVASEASAASLASARSRSGLLTLSPTATPSSTQSSSSSLTPIATPSSGATSGQVSSTCAGDWDPQVKSATAAAVWSVLAGSLVWLAFALVRGRMSIMYEARRWFIPIEFVSMSSIISCRAADYASWAPGTDPSRFTPPFCRSSSPRYPFSHRSNRASQQTSTCTSTPSSLASGLSASGRPRRSSPPCPFTRSICPA